MKRLYFHIKPAVLKGVSILIILFFGLLNAYSQSLDSAYKYFDAGQYEKAALEFEKVLPLIEKEYGASDTTLYSFLLIYAGVSCEGIHQHAEAEKYYLKVISIYEEINALSNDVYITAINKLGELYRTMGKFENAEALYTQTLEKNKKVFGEESPNYINTLNNIARLYQAMGKYEKAESFYLQSLGISRQVFGDMHPGDVVLLNNIATLYHKSGSYLKAEPMYMKALEISKQAYGEEHPNTVTLLNNLGTLFDDIGNYEEAERFYRQALEIRKRTLGSDHPDYAIILNNLAQLYFKMGSYERAEPMYQQALAISRKAYGEEHIGYSLALNNLGALYHNKGDYGKAESLYLEALNIRKKVLGENHPDYATSLNNIALLYHDLGNYEKAEPFYQQALDIRQKTIGEGHPDYATSLNNIALFYQETGNAAKSETLFLQGLNIRKNAYGEEHPDYAVALNNLALFYNYVKKYDKAEAMFLQTLQIIKKIQGELHPDYAAALNNLAELYDATGKYEQAESLYLQALEITKKVSGKNHPNYATTLSNLAVLYQSTGNFKLAEQSYEEALNTYLSQIRQQFGFLSEKEKEKYLDKIMFFFKTYQNFIIGQHAINPHIGEKAYDIELSGKGLMLNADRQLRMFILNSGDSSAVRTYNSWITVRASLARQYSMPLTQQMTDTKALEDKANDLERQLARVFSGRNELAGLQNIHWKDVQNQLNPGEIAVEFTHFPFYNGRQWTDSVMYAALLLKKDDTHPAIIPLFEGRQLDAVLQRGRASEMNYINDLYRWIDPDDQSIPGKGQQLYDLVWKPLETYLDGIHAVYFSPSGRLHQLSFAAIPCGGTEMLSDRFQLHQLSSTARVTIKHQESPVKRIVLYGGINYDAGFDKMKSIADQYNKSFEKPSLQATRSLSRENTRSGSWMYLDGTLAEVEKIRKFAEGKGIKSVILTGNEAVEESVKNLSGNSSPEVIHIATHGFFFPDAQKDYDKSGSMAVGERATHAFRLSDNPLMRSGLAFAGANHAWAGEEIPPELDDGILTAYEVSGMYLPKTELVVLSACETGLGEIKGSEGVFGLQRSFKIAGTEYILMSLWQIPDYQTSELMNRFYAEWFSGKPTREALKAAQDFMKGKYPLLPFMWAGFVLVR